MIQNVVECVDSFFKFIIIIIYIYCKHMFGIFLFLSFDVYSCYCHYYIFLFTIVFVGMFWNLLESCGVFCFRQMQWNM
jgi:hypothetical protein